MAKHTDEILFETSDYYVTLGKVFIEDRKDYIDGYILVNKVTGVVEGERTSLPEMIYICKRMTTMLAEMYGTPPAEDDAIPGQLPLIVEPTDEGKPN